MDSPDTSLYKPVSLSDTLTQNSKRAYRSSGATLTSSTSTHRLAGPRPSIAQTPSWHSRDRSDAAKREAAAMCEVLGIPGGGDSAVDATPRPSSGRSLNSAAARTATTIREESPVEVISLKATLGDKDHEIATLRRELAVTLRDKKDLAAQVARCEREHRDSATASGSGLDIRQMEDLERAFADQEKLLAGYQKELEKQAEELDRTRSRCAAVHGYWPETICSHSITTTSDPGAWPSTSKRRTVRRSRRTWASRNGQREERPLLPCGTSSPRGRASQADRRQGS